MRLKRDGTILMMEMRKRKYMINDRYHDVSFKYDDCFVGMIINVDGYYKADE